KVARISGELEERRGRRRHEHAVHELLMRAGEGPQFGRQREGQQEVGAREQTGALPLQPALGLLPVTLRAVPVATGVVTVLARAAVITRLDMPTEGHRATGHDVGQGPAVRRQQRRAVERLVDLTRRADDVRELEHERPGRSEPCINRLIGSTAVWRTSGVRCVYTCVVRALVCPRYPWMGRRLTQPS